jgi:hypothetical protein
LTSFDARIRLESTQVAQLEKAYGGFRKIAPLAVWFGRGHTIGQINLRYDRLLGKSFMTIQSNGRLWVASKTRYPHAFLDQLRKELADRLNLSSPDASKEWCIEIEEWGAQVDTIIGLLRELVMERETAGSSSSSNPETAYMEIPKESWAKG